jgi:hypothetical protein
MKRHECHSNPRNKEGLLCLSLSLETQLLNLNKLVHLHNSDSTLIQREETLDQDSKISKRFT